MKSENGIKKMLFKPLIGFPVGITLLIITYISVYLITGEAAFIAEISQLHSIEILLAQILSTGIVYYILFIFFNIISDLRDKELENKFMTKHPSETVLIIVLSTFCILLSAMVLLTNIEVFSQNIITLNIVIFLVVFSLGAITFFIKKAREQRLIKEITQTKKDQ